MIDGSNYMLTKKKKTTLIFSPFLTLGTKQSTTKDMRDHLSKWPQGAGETAQWLGTLVVLPEDLGLLWEFIQPIAICVPAH